MSRYFRYDPESQTVVEVEREVVHNNPKWPIASDAMGIHPSQIEEARAFNRSRGVPTTDYTSDGRPILRSSGHRKAYMRAWKYFDKSGFN